MNLFNLLVQLPHERLRSLANIFGVSTASPSKRTILNELAARYRDEEFLSSLVEELPMETQGLLSGLVFFTPETVRIKIPPVLRRVWWGEDSSEEWLFPLLDLGLLFKDFSDENNVFLFPEEIRRTLETLFLSPYRNLSPQGEMELSHMAERHPGLEALFHLACVLLHHRAIQTQKGAIHRKTIERWAARLGGIGAREDFFQFIFDFCLKQGLVCVSRNHFYPTPAIGAWFSQDEKIARNELWLHYLNERLLPDRAQQILPLLFRIAGHWIKEKGTSPVFTLADTIALPEMRLTRVQLEDSLQWMAFLGMIRLDNPEKPSTFFLTRDGIDTFCRCDLSGIEPPPNDLCVLQPNFDLLVPPGVGYSELWKLEHLAEFRRRDVFTEYHISQHSILFGMRRGWTQEETISFFHRLTGDKFSGNVEYSLEEWCRKYGQITLRRTVLVECATPELAEEMTHIPEINGMLEKRLSDRCYAVAESNARPLLKILRERGYEPSAAKRLSGDE